MTREDGVANSTHEDGPEPAEEQRSNEAADGGVEENAIGGAVGGITGERGAEKSGNSADEEDEFHEVENVERAAAPHGMSFPAHLRIEAAESQSAGADDDFSICAEQHG